MWKVHDEELKNAADGAAARQLFDILEATFGKDAHKLPQSLRQGKPFVLCRDFCKSRWTHATDVAQELYRFQLGPRTWAKPIYVYDGHRISDRLPRYEQEAEGLAKQLKVSGWEKVALALVEPVTAKDADPSVNEIAVTLCWQDEQRYVVVHDRVRRRAVALNWIAEGFELLGEAHPGRLYQSKYANPPHVYDRPVISLDEGAKNIKAAQRAGQMEEFAAAIQWRYATRLDHRLDGLLLETCDRLQTIEGNIGMAFAGHRFNDALGDDSWLAVRHDNFAWENGAYFQSNAASLRGAPTEIHTIIGVLVHLKTCGIATAFNECYGYSIEDLDVSKRPASVALRGESVK
ncbi:hypothetical protein MTR62_20775, partial [Novosphingobium sp. 1949]